MNRGTVIALLAAGSLIPHPARATTDLSPDEVRVRRVFKHALPGTRNSTITLVEVTYAPGARSAPHSHPNGVTAFVTLGSIVSEVNDLPIKTYHAGDAWYEAPGSVHQVSRNASKTKQARLLAIFMDEST